MSLGVLWRRRHCPTCRIRWSTEEAMKEGPCTEEVTEEEERIPAGTSTERIVSKAVE
jgi:transcriptional regulator NrdR family protein